MPEGLNSQTGDQVSRWVYVFWRSDTDPEKSAREWCDCVSNSPAVQGGCKVNCKLIDLVLQSGDPAAKYASGNTIQVVGVKNGVVVCSVERPVFCKDIYGCVDTVCG